jgi:hypothetical protein
MTTPVTYVELDSPDLEATTSFMGDRAVHDAR